VYNLLDIIPNEAYTQNIKSIIKDVQKALNKDINTPFALKSDKKSASQKSLEKFYNRFRIENPEFYKFEPTDEELTLNFINQRGKNYYLPTTDITGAKAKAVEDKLLAYIPTLPSKSIIVDKNNGQTLKQNPKSLFVIYDNEKEDNKKALTQQKITNFATMVAIDKDVIDRQIDEIISKSMGYDTISFNLSKGYFQDIKESNPELFNYGSQRLKDTFGITNPNFEETTIQEDSIETNILSIEVKNGILTPKNVFTVKPVQAADKKAIVKASVATQYIGFSEGITNSSTELYRKQAGKFANTGNYSSNDAIFISIGGKRGDVTVRKEQQDRTINEAIKAIEAGATLITDNKSYVESSDYNEGEKRLAKNLEAKGYNYSEQTVDGQILGIWNKNINTEVNNSKVDIPTEFSKKEGNFEISQRTEENREGEITSIFQVVSNTKNGLGIQKQTTKSGKIRYSRTFKGYHLQGYTDTIMKNIENYPDILEKLKEYGKTVKLYTVDDKLNYTKVKDFGSALMSFLDNKDFVSNEQYMKLVLNNNSFNNLFPALQNVSNQSTEVENKTEDNINKIKPEGKPEIDITDQDNC